MKTEETSIDAPTRKTTRRALRRSRGALIQRAVFLFAVVLVAVALGAAAGLPALAQSTDQAAAGAPETTSEGNDTVEVEATWSEVDRLIDEQKFEAARALVERLRQAAREAGDGDELTKALVRETQLLGALHGYERAVRFLREESWPADGDAQVVLGLFYGHTLHRYLGAYRWEIAQREEVAGDEEGELAFDRWTMPQIAAEIHRAYAGVWSHRAAWGTRSLGTLSRFVVQNDAPPRIRGTLRDTIASLWVDLLVDGSLWTPEESNATWKLDPASLLAPVAVGEAQAEALADPQHHPLRKIAWLLGETSAWHGEAGRPEAAFDARRRLIATLAPRFSSARALFVDALRADLDALGRDYPWWSMGVADLAELTAGYSDPWAIERARDVAKTGRVAHPKSLGGQRCAALESRWEQPLVQIEAMQVDGPERRSLLVRHANVGRLYFRAYRIDFAARLDRPKGDGWRQLESSSRELLEHAREEPLREWTVDLPPTPDLRRHQTFVTPPLAEVGLYAILASQSPRFDQSRDTIYATEMRVSDLSMVVESEAGGEIEAEVRAADDGEPLTGIGVELWRMDNGMAGNTRVATLPTGPTGRARFEVPYRRGQRNQYVLVARRAADLVHLATSPRLANRPEPQQQVLIYTDRSIYRPGQEILWKIVGFELSGDRRRAEVEAGRTLTVELRDLQGEEVESVEVTTDAWGAASGSFRIPAGRALGHWSLTAGLQTQYLLIEEYKRPTFEVQVADAERSLRFGSPITLRAEAKYYFGAPVSDGRAAWRVRRTPLYPRWFRQVTAGDEILASGDGPLDADGTLEITFTPEADPELASTAQGRQVSYAYELEVDVTDAGGETRTGRRTFRAGFVDVRLDLDEPEGLPQTETEIRLGSRRTTLDGGGAAGSSAWTLVRLLAPERPLLPAERPVEPPEESEETERDRKESGEERPAYRTDGDQQEPRWAGSWGRPLEMELDTWKASEEARSGTVKHGDDGRANVELAGLDAGPYRLRLVTKDSEDREVVAEQSFFVFGEERGPTVPLFLRVDRELAEPGETVTVLVHSGFDGGFGADEGAEQALVFEARRGDTLLQRDVLWGGVPTRIELPIEEADRGGIELSASLVRDHQRLVQSARIEVPWTDRRLEVELSSFRDLLRPGDQETWTVTVRDAEGEPLPVGGAEVLASMYDRSLDLFADHRPPDPAWLWPENYRSVSQSSTTGRHGWLRPLGAPLLAPGAGPAFQDDRLSFYDGYPIGGPGLRGRSGMHRAMMQSMAVPSPPPPPPAPAPPGDMALELAETTIADAGAVTVTAEAPDVEMNKVSVAKSIPAGEPGDADSFEVRENFAETAFWQPHLLLGEDGAVSFEFVVPDAVTEWQVWVRALTKRLHSGGADVRVRSAKELLARPYLPRFFREGDLAELRVVVSNQGEETLAGHLDFDLRDPETEASRRADFGLAEADASGVRFEIAPGASTTLTFPVRAPRDPGEIAVRAAARVETERGALSDGELRPLPILPSRLYLAQSRFAALEGAESRTLRFDDLLTSFATDTAPEDESLETESLVVTLDGQLLTTVLAALPYLVDFPYACTEQTLNRFVSTGILQSVFVDHPLVADLARGLADERGDTVVEPWSGNDDPNRRMLLEETPWLRTARGGEAPEGMVLRRILDPDVATEVRDQSLGRLLEAQNGDGSFPWWPGGPASPYMTRYVLDSFARALEFGVEVPKDPVVRAFDYLRRHYEEEIVPRLGERAAWTLADLVYTSWLLSSYPDDSWTGGQWPEPERRKLLDISFEHWRALSPRLKGSLALALHRAQRGDDARLVWASVMDSVRSDQDLGSYWAPEDRAWLWYNDTIETHAWALRVETELDPESPHRKGLAQWLLLQKKLGHWKSTRATAEVIYSLVHYMKSAGQLGVREAATVRVGDVSRDFVFAGEGATAADRRQQWVFDGPEVVPAMGTIEVSKETPGFLLASATWHFATDRLPAQGDGDLFAVERRFFRRVLSGGTWTIEPLREGDRVEVGDQVEVHLTMRARHAAEYVHLRDPRGAGFEPEDLTSGYVWDFGVVHYREIRDSATNFFFERLPVGEYDLKYRIRAAVAGTFRVGPAQVQSMYAPEFVAYSAGAEMRIESDRAEE